jgi:hypothetical protein
MLLPHACASERSIEQRCRRIRSRIKRRDDAPAWFFRVPMPRTSVHQADSPARIEGIRGVAPRALSFKRVLPAAAHAAASCALLYLS